MNSEDLKIYEQVRAGGGGFYEQKRGLIAVWGKEAVQFLDGMITNDMKTLGDGEQMLAAFPNAQGRLLAVIRVLRQGDRFLIETEEATREKVFNNLFRFTYAGDFFVEDLSGQFGYFEVFGEFPAKSQSREVSEASGLVGGHIFSGRSTMSYFVPADDAEEFRSSLIAAGVIKIDDELYETLRIESGIPKYGVDMDETTIVPELGLDGLISYNKGCYIGQEIIARIHFRGHVAKQLTGLMFTTQAETRPVGSVLETDAELTSLDGKNAGRITSVIYSPKLDQQIVLALVRFDYLAEHTVLRSSGMNLVVKNLPFV